MRQHRGRQARRHDAVHDAAPRRDPHRGRAAPGVLNVVHRDRPESPARRSSATRSCARSPSPARPRPGKRVAALAAQGTKRVTLELGGSRPDDHLRRRRPRKAASAASMGRFYNCGQACLAIKRVYVFDVRGRRGDRGDRGRRRSRLRVGLGTDEGVQLGPLHSERQRALLEDQLARRCRPGGEIVAGGGRPDDPRLAERLVPRADRRRRPAARLADGDARRSSARSCPSGACATSTRRSRAPTPRRSGWGRRSGRATSIAPSARRRSSTRATRGSTRRRRSTTSCRSAASKASGYGKEHGFEALDYYTRREVGGRPAVGRTVDVTAERASVPERYNASLLVDRNVDAAAATRRPSSPPTRR